MHALRSLHLRLWGVVGVACLPLFLITFLDYRERRQEAIKALQNEITQKMTAGRQAEEAALRSMRQTFQIMARADYLLSPGPADCSGLALRLVQSMENFANLGAVQPDGQVFCSAIPTRMGTSMADRLWFQDALAHDGITEGVIVIDRISLKYSMVFGYPVRDERGRLQAVLFATIQLS